MVSQPTRKSYLPHQQLYTITECGQSANKEELLTTSTGGKRDSGDGPVPVSAVSCCIASCQSPMAVCSPHSEFCQSSCAETNIVRIIIIIISVIIVIIINTIIIVVDDIIIIIAVVIVIFIVIIIIIAVIIVVVVIIIIMYFK